MIKNIGKKMNIFKKLLLVLLSAVISVCLFSDVCVLARTAQPTKSPKTPTAKVTATASQSPLPSVSPSPSPSPTISKEPEFLQDFTVPPLQASDNINADATPSETAKPNSAGATIGIVEVDNIEAQKPFMWSDLIKYLAYVFFVLAGLAVIYGIVCMATLIFFKKDITLAGLRQRKKKKKKNNKK